MAKHWTLGPLDDIMPDIDNCILLCFSVIDTLHSRTAEILTQAYVRLLSENPMLGSRVMTSDSPDLRPGKKTLRASNTRPHLDIVDGYSTIGMSYQELKRMGMPRKFLPASLIVPSRDTEDPAARWSTSMRATFVPGGCFLAFNTSHILMDGTSILHFVRVMAAHATAISQNSPGQASCRFSTTATDIASINPPVVPGQYGSLKGNASSWHMLGLDYRPKEMSSAVLAAKLAPVTPVTRLYHFDRTSLSKLKDHCLHNGYEHERISTVDALTALLWRCVMRARAGSDRDASSLMMPMDIRKMLTPAVSDEYLGNSVIYSITKSTVGYISDGSNLPLGAVAQSIRASRQSSQRREVLSETLQLAASMPDVSNLGLVYPTWLGNDLVVSSLYSHPFCEITWGSTFGEHNTPDFFRFPDGIFDGLCFILPRGKDGSVEVQLTMDEKHIDALESDHEFASYMVGDETRHLKAML